MSFEPERLNVRLRGARSERLELRAPQVEDAVPLFEATRHPAFNQHLMWDMPPDLDAVRTRVKRVMQRARDGACAAFSVIDRASGKWAALFRLEPRERASWTEFGLWTHPSFWGAGHGEEITRLGIEQAFLHSRLEGVVACASPKHQVSLRLLERCGLEPIGIAPRAHESGHSVPLQQMLLTRTRWAWLRMESIAGWLPDAAELAEPLPASAPRARMH
jgi:RimJ/RimL family protein N-acetyltransferase